MSVDTAIIKFESVTRSTHDGRVYTIRMAKASDAQALIDLAKNVMGESDYMITEADEFDNTLAWRRAPCPFY